MRAVRLVFATALIAFAAPSAGAQETAPEIISLGLNGVVDPFVASYVKSGIEAADDANAAAVLLTIDTPGGLDSSMREIVKAILNTDVPVVCFVSPQGARAASAGAFILISCPVAAMAPGTNVGAAHPVGVSGAIQSEKVTNDAVAYIRSLAEQRGRNADWAEDAVRDSVSASAEEALELGVIDVIAPSVPDLLETIDGDTVQTSDGEVVLDVAGARITERNMNAGLGFLHGLLDPNVAFIFFWLGLFMIILEFFVPGGVMGILGGVMFVLAIVTFGMLPVQLIGIALLLASVVFLILELKHPGLGVPAIGGIISLILGGWFLFDSAVPNARVSPWVIAPVALGAAIFFPIVIRAALRVFRKPPAGGTEQLIGKEGTVERELDPKGVVLVASEEWTAVSESGPVPKGQHVRVVGVDGLKLKVEAANEAHPSEHEQREGSKA
ncbi:MAG: nodulation protein NfeD [Actinomycetota bacterium]